MPGKRVMILPLVALAGWFVGAWLSQEIPSGAEDGDAGLRSYSVLADRQVGALIVKGEMSLQIARSASWARSVPLSPTEETMAELRKLPDGTAVEVARFIVGQRWLQEDPCVALRFADDQEVREQILRTLPLEELVALLNSEPTLEHELVKTLASVDPEKALALVNEIRSISRDSGAAIIEGFVELGGFSLAVEKLGEIRPIVARIGASHALAGAWAGEDPAASLAWIQSLPDSDKPFWMLVSWTSGLSQADPEEALRHAATIESPLLRARAERRALSSFAKENAERAFTELRGLDLTDRMMLATAGGLVRDAAVTEPAEALRQYRLVAEQQGFAEAKSFHSERDRIFKRTLSQWARRDLEAARAFAEALIDRDEKQSALEGIDEATLKK